MYVEKLCQTIIPTCPWLPLLCKLPAKSPCEGKTISRFTIVWRLKRTCICLLENPTILFHYNLTADIFKTRNLINFPHFCFLRRLCCELPFSTGHSTLRILQAIFTAKTSKSTESRDEAALVAMPRPPGSMSEPSRSQGPWGTSPPELLELLPDLTPLQLSFVLLGMGADLTHSWGPGSSIRASTPEPGSSMPHGHCSPQGPGQGAAACPRVFPWDIYRQVSSSPWETWQCPSGLERGFQLGACGLVLLSLAVVPLLDSAFSSPAALQRLMLELDLIFLARSVLFSSSRSTFQSILGATAAQLWQPAAPWLVLSPRVSI